MEALVFEAFLLLLCLYDQKSSLIVDRSSPAVSHRAVQRHYKRNSSVNLLGRLLFIDFDVAGRICTHENVVHVPAQDGVPVVSEAFLKHKAHQFLGGRAHAGKTLSKRNHGKTFILQRLYDHASIPSVVGNFTNVIPGVQVIDGHGR